MAVQFSISGRAAGQKQYGNTDQLIISIVQSSVVCVTAVASSVDVLYELCLWRKIFTHFKNSPSSVNFVCVVMFAVFGCQLFVLLLFLLCFVAVF